MKSKQLLKNKKLVKSGVKVTTLDKIRAYYLESTDTKVIKLTETQERMREMYEYALTYFFNGYTKHQTSKFLQSVHGVSYTQSYQVINNAIALFGDLTAATKEGKKAVYIEQLQRLAQKAEEKGDLWTAKECIKEAARIDGAYDEFEVDPSLVVLPMIVLSNDASLLESDTPIDIDHSEIEDDEEPAQ